MSKAKRRGRLIVGGVGLAAVVAGLVAFSGSAKAADKAPQFPSNMVVVYNAAQAKAAEDLADKKVERGEVDGVVVGSSMSGEAVSNAVLGQLAEVARAYPSVHFVIGVGTRVGPPMVSAMASSSKASGTYVSDAEEIAAYPTAVADAAFYAFNGREPGSGDTPPVKGGPTKPSEPANTLPEIVSPLLSADPVGGRFYQIERGDNMSGIARDVLNAAKPGAGNDDRDRLEYIRCATAATYNRSLYGTTSFTSSYPDFYGSGGQGLRTAFLPGNANALSEILAGRMPSRGYDGGGTRIEGVGSSFGLLWLPKVDRASLDLGEVVCTENEPPAELRDQLS